MQTGMSVPTSTRHSRNGVSRQLVEDWEKTPEYQQPAVVLSKVSTAVLWQVLKAFLLETME